MRGVINKSSLFMLSWKNFLQSWHRQSSSWWILVVQRGAGFSSSSFFAFPLLRTNWILSARHPWERRNPTPPHLRAGGLSSSALQMWEESHVPFTASCSLMSQRCPECPQMEGHLRLQELRGLDPLLLFLPSFVKMRRVGNLQAAWRETPATAPVPAGWEDTYLGWDTCCGSWDVAGSCSQKAVTKIVTEAFNSL